MSSTRIPQITCARTLLLATVAVSASVMVGQSHPTFSPEYEAADRRIVRQPPNAFVALPSKVRDELTRRHCAVPQIGSTPHPHNVIKGEFIRSGQIDWAVLCSVNRRSAILVFPNGSGSGVIEIAQEPDRQTLQEVGENRTGYSRQISTARPHFILAHWLAYRPGERPPSIHHDGINDAFAEKASIVFYFSRGKWLKLQGAD